jgi:CSLREA domain-containing protein
MYRFLVALTLFVSLSASASTYTVNDLGDGSDANPGNDVCATAGAVCTLRAAIEEANAHAGPDTIAFSVAGTISGATAYPSLIDETTIDGTTAPGYAGVPVVLLDGAFSIDVGLHFDLGADDSLLQGLQLSGFSTTAVLSDADGVSIRNNYLGPVLGGTPNEDGLQLNGSGSVAGGEDGLGNVISGNNQFGIIVTGSDHRISDNLIGTDAAGTGALANDDDGIHIAGAATGLIIGSADEDAVNVISGNGDNGIEINDGTGNTIAGNYIGLDVTGTAAIPNFLGIRILSGSNTIGTTEARNVISGNDDDGIDIEASNTVVHNNYVGTDATGLVGIGNAGFGIAGFFGTNLEIGGSDAGEGNVISFNGADGVILILVADSHITGNIMGLDSAGTATLGNGSSGILLFSSDGITIDDNTISGNSLGGIADSGGTDNIIENNRVGTTADGSAPEGNLGTGIELFGTTGTIVRSNVVSANDGHGIETTSGSVGGEFYLNIVGLSADLSTPMGNALDGINVCDGAEDTVVGSVALGGNIISANAENGIGVEPTALRNNTWAANSIYDNTLLGIDIAIDGVTPNDPNDPDEGPNHYQNFPELDSAVTTATASQVRGTIDTIPSTAFTVHFYSSPAADPSGFGEGRTYLGAVSGTTDVNGDASFVFNGPALTTGHVVTATGTTADGTSEFSAAIAANVAPAIAFSSATYSVSEAGVSATITVTRSGDLSAPSTVDYATSNNTATAGNDYTATSGTLTFAAEDASETFSVLIANDTTDEADELVNLTLSNPLGASLAAPSTAQLTILDDDDPPTISIDDISQSEATTPFAFTVTLSQASALTVNVDYATANDIGTDAAAAGSDYTAIPTTTLTFAPGVTTQTVNVAVANDAITEPDETFFVNLSNPVNATFADNQGLGTIENDDAEPTVTIDDVSLAEGDAGNTNFVFTLTLSHLTASDVTVNYSTANDTATAADYTAKTDVATITANTLSTTITIAVTGETLPELDETFFVNLLGATNATIADNQGLGTIQNDDGQPGVTIDDITLNEGDAGTTNFVFTLALSEVSGVDVTVNYQTASGSATAGSDYTAQTNTATITAGTLTTTITIPVSGETLPEVDETFFVNLTGATNATVTDNQGLGTIVNDDGQPAITIDDVTLAEGNAGTTNFVFTLTLSEVSGADVTVNYTTANGTATAGSDYTAQTNTATITAGSLTTTITVLVSGDTLPEVDETFFVNLTAATNATIADNQGLGTITNDDAEPTVSIDNVSLAEGDAGTTNFVFTLTLSEVSGADVTVNYTTAEGTATAGSDYTAQTNTAVIADGTLTTTITIPVTGDTLPEIDETFFVNLTGVANATISDNQGLGTIQNDEGLPSITIDNVTLAEGDAGTTNFVFTVTLSEVSGSDVTVDYATANNSATAGSDYTAQSGTATIDSGTLTTTITVPVSGDTLSELDETFFVNLTNPANAAITDNQGLATITDDDGQPSISVGDISLEEGDAGTTDFTFTITLSEVSGADVGFSYSTDSFTAAAGIDFIGIADEAVIPAGALSTTITIQVIGEVVAETDETFFFTLSNGFNATIADNQAIATIENDDIAVSDLSISKTTPFASSGFTPGDEVMYTIRVTNAGPDAAAGITVTDVLPPNTTYLTTASGDALCTGTSTVTCTIATLAGGATATIELYVTVTGSDPISNTATVTSPAISDPAPANDAATVTINPRAVSSAAIPTASEWGLMLLALGLAVVAMRKM